MSPNDEVRKLLDKDASQKLNGHYCLIWKNWRSAYFLLKCLLEFNYQNWHTKLNTLLDISPMKYARLFSSISIIITILWEFGENVNFSSRNIRESDETFCPIVRNWNLGPFLAHVPTVPSIFPGSLNNSFGLILTNFFFSLYFFTRTFTMVHSVRSAF